MLSFTDHYNVISIDRLLSQTKTGKDSWYFHNSLLNQPEFSSAEKTFFFLLKTQKTIVLQQVTGENTPNLVLKRYWCCDIPKNSTTRENIKILRMKEDCKTYTQKRKLQTRN